MESFRKLISCSICHNRLVDPVFLPCGWTVCSSHMMNSSDTFECKLCSSKHDVPQNGFVKNLAVSNALNENLDQQIFGENYTEARKNSQQLGLLLDECKSLCENKEAFIHDFFSILRNKIDLNQEKFQAQFNDANKNLRSLVESYEKECYDKLQCSNDFNDAHSLHDESVGYLNALHIDNGHWKWISQTTREKRIESKKNYEKLKDELLLNKATSFVVDNLDFRKMIDNIEEDENKIKQLTRNLLKGIYTLQSVRSKKYLSAENNGTKPFVANRDAPKEWEIFSFVEQENDTIAIKAICNNKYGSIHGTNNNITATHNHPEDNNQRFKILFAFFDPTIIALRSCANNRTICMHDDPNSPVNCWGYRLCINSMFRVRQHNMTPFDTS